MNKIKVLVVDDSAFFRNHVVRILKSDRDIEIVGLAHNGAEAVEKAKELKPDVITMDVEMPVMGGIEAVTQIMAHNPTPILMLSSVLESGASLTFDALEAGAADFMSKDNGTSRGKELSKFSSLLLRKIRSIAKPSNANAVQKRERLTLSERIGKRAAAKGVKTELGGMSHAKQERLSAQQQQEQGVTHTAQEEHHLSQRITHTANGSPRVLKSSGQQYKLLAIGSSTGGPVAVQEVLSKFPVNFPYPIILVQHMPSSFTPTFAERLNSSTNLTVKEAQDGDLLRAGTAYLARGGTQLTVERRGGAIKLKVSDGMGLTYRPSVDVTFSSIANVLPGCVLGVILTGMGADGCEGAALMKKGGSVIWSQSQESCVVYGMPQAVEKSGISKEVFDIADMGENILIELNIQ